jgi:acyl carrier protein
VTDVISKDAFRAAVVEGIRRVKSTDTVRIADDETFTNAGLDSLDSMNLVLEVESITGLNFGEFDLSDANTIDDFYRKAEQLAARA